MPFNTKLFTDTQFEARTSEVSAKCVADYFDEGDSLVFTVQGLDGFDLAIINHKVEKLKLRAALIDVALDGSDRSFVEEVRKKAGVDKKTPEQLARYNEMIVCGLIEPQLPRETINIFAKRFPMFHQSLASEIMALTQIGQLAKKKPSPSTAKKK